MSETTPAHATQRSSGSGLPLTRGHSCQRCQRRKIRCDGQTPCDSCVAAGTDCERNSSRQRQYRVAKPTRENASRRTNLISQDRTSIGHTFSQSTNPINHSSDAEADLRQVTQIDRCSISSNNPRENSNPIRVESVLFGNPSLIRTEDAYWPDAVQTFYLWQVYIDSVHPLTNFLHPPTMQRLVLEAAGPMRVNLSAQSKAILSAVFLAAVESLDDAECIRSMGISRNSLLKKLFIATQHNLLSADLMNKPDQIVLQAFVLYLVSFSSASSMLGRELIARNMPQLAARQHSSPHCLWLVISVAVRCAQRLGIHRENNLTLMPIFQAEMCRRLWWQVHLLNRHYTNLCDGIDSTDGSYATPFDTKRPLNLNDADLHPDMQTSPTERQGSTEMMFCSVRYEVGEFVQQPSLKKGSPQDRLKAIKKLEQDLDEKFARHCDESIPLQRVTRFLIKTIGYRLILIHCYSALNTEENLSSENKTQTFDTALQLLQTQNASCADAMLDRYRWHTKLFYNFEALFPVLRALAFDTLDQRTSAEAWKQVALTYQFNPQLLSASGLDQADLFKNLNSLALKASSRHSQMDSSIPNLPTALVAQLSSQQQPHADGEVVSTSILADMQLPAQVIDPAPSEAGLTGGMPDSSWQQPHLENDDQAWEYWLSLVENEYLEF